MTYDIETIAWTAGLLVAAAVLIRIVRNLRRSIRHGENLGALPQELSGDGTLRGDAFVRKRDALGNELIRDARELPGQERDIVLHALWHAMLLEAASGGGVDGREVRFIADFFDHLSGRKLAQDAAAEAAELAVANPQAALTEIAKAKGASEPSRRHILEGAMLVSLADGVLADSEANRLGDIADALGVGLEERGRIYSSMTNRLGSKT